VRAQNCLPLGAELAVASPLVEGGSDLLWLLVQRTQIKPAQRGLP
jgi:hypothetical protein